MPLEPGTRLGPYEIIAPLGSGGMGEVFRARDTRLDRTVAIKILPKQFSADSARKQRFEREAKTISTLNHPNICTLYDVGNQDGMEYLVMECIDGETLAERLVKAALPTEQVLKIGAEIADGLDKAHRSGIVHRDLKPGNIMLTKTGAKLLDFGLAKPTVAATASSITMTAIAASSPVTQEGTIVGTFQYMSPEQVEGKELDGRSDIFSLGAVLYEMITGKRAFEGKSQLSVASAIIEKEPPPITECKPLAPAALDRAIRRCLAKDPEDRWQTARDLAIELKWLATPSGEFTRPAVATPRTRITKWLPWALAALGLLAAAVLGLVLRSVHGSSGDRVVLRASIPPPENSQFASIETDEGGVPAVSPDGLYLVTPVHGTDGKVRLWLRTLQSNEGKILDGTEGAGHVFWSPDSHSIGFFANGKMKRIDIDGKSVYNLADAPLGRGGTWNSDGTILFSPQQAEPLYKVPASGGTPAAVTKLDKAHGISSHRWPQFLPDGRHFIFILRSEQPDQTGLYLGSLDRPDIHMIVPTVFNAIYVSSGYLLFIRDEILFAQKFDAATQKLSGEPISLPDHVGLFSPALNALFSASNNGMLLYYPAQAGSAGVDLVWFDRSGKRGETISKTFLAGSSISPDGNSVAMSAYSPNEWIPKLWILDLQRNTKTPLTKGQGSNPVWMPDSQTLIFGRGSLSVSHIYRAKANGAGAEETILASEGFSEVPLSLCSDGKMLLVLRSPQDSPQTSSVWSLALDGDKKLTQFLPTDQKASRAVFSPDCNWVAYESRLTGEREISVVHFPDGGRKYQVSSAGGFDPRWRRDGKELYFYSPQDNSISAVPMQEKGQELVLGKPAPLFVVHPLVPRLGVFDLTPDAQKFLVFGDTGSLSRVPLAVTMNWDAGLAKK